MEEKWSVLEFFSVVLDCFPWHTFSTCEISFRRMALRRNTSLSWDVLRIKIGLLYTDLKKATADVGISVEDRSVSQLLG